MGLFDFLNNSFGGQVGQNRFKNVQGDPKAAYVVGDDYDPTIDAQQDNFHKFMSGLPILGSLFTPTSKAKNPLAPWNR